MIKLETDSAYSEVLTLDCNSTKASCVLQVTASKEGLLHELSTSWFKGIVLLDFHELCWKLTVQIISGYLN